MNTPDTEKTAAQDTVTAVIEENNTVSKESTGNNSAIGRKAFIGVISFSLLIAAAFWVNKNKPELTSLFMKTYDAGSHMLSDMEKASVTFIDDSIADVTHSSAYNAIVTPEAETVEVTTTETSTNDIEAVPSVNENTVEIDAIETTDNLLIETPETTVSETAADALITEPVPATEASIEPEIIAIQNTAPVEIAEEPVTATSEATEVTDSVVDVTPAKTVEKAAISPAVANAAPVMNPYPRMVGYAPYPRHFAPQYNMPQNRMMMQPQQTYKQNMERQRQMMLRQQQMQQVWMQNAAKQRQQMQQQMASWRAESEKRRIEAQKRYSRAM